MTESTSRPFLTLLSFLTLVLNNSSLAQKQDPDTFSGIKMQCEDLYHGAGAPDSLVQPIVDAANSRWLFFSSACRPFGMVNLSPDMAVDGAWNSGYRYNEDTILFFSHIHAWQMSGIPVMPVTGRFKGQLGPHVYGSLYSHDNEFIRPGYHAVYLKSYGIWAELTSTTRVGFHRYTFPAGGDRYILLDLGTLLGPSGTKEGLARMTSRKEIEGYAVMEKTSRRPKPLKVYYVMQFDTPFESMAAWQNGRILGTVENFTGPDGGVFMKIPSTGKNTVLMKVGISYTGIEAARENIRAELPGWNFDAAVHDSYREWNDYLGRIEVRGGTFIQRRRFYTDLWHALQGRRIISDVKGTYPDNTGPETRTGQIPPGKDGKPAFNHFNSDSFWGAQWTLNTLWDLVYPEITEQFIRSMLRMYDDGGLIPRGPSGGNYTFVMTGASSTPFIVSAWMKGIRGFDGEKAYEGMRKNAFPGGLMSKAGYEHKTYRGGGIEYYIEKGYVPYPLGDKTWGAHQDGAGQTLEYAYQDWCLAQMARALGKEEDYRLFMERATNYKNLYDPGSGWMRPRNRDGNWFEPFDPLAVDEGFVESNAAQATWFVPHDVKGLAGLMGGRDSLVQKLDRSFRISEQTDFHEKKFNTDDPFVKAERARTYINYGNQPSMEVAFIFNYAGAPWLTQYWSREVVNRIYSDLTPEKGYNGDEDQGLMGSLAVLMKIGLFDLQGGAALNPVYEIGSPLFNEVVIHLDPHFYPGKTFTITARDNSDGNRFIQNAELNGKPLEKCWFIHDDIVSGGRLILQMGAVPDKNWGSAPGDAPPSMSDQ